MRLVFGLVLLLGVALAGGAVYMAQGFFDQQKQRIAQAEALQSQIVPTKDVFVVNKRMRYGQRLTVDDVILVRWPEAAIPEGSFTSPDELFPEGPDVQRSVLRTMEPNEAVMKVKVTDAGEDAGVSARLSPGMRAFTIQTDVTTGVSGFLRPGDRVDIFWTGRLKNENATKLIDKNVKIVAINQSADEDRRGPIVARTVTVEINPRQIASLATAQSTGRLSLSLVGVEDEIVADDVEVGLTEVLGIEEEVKVEVQKERKCFVKRRVGEELVNTNIQIPCANTN